MERTRDTRSDTELDGAGESLPMLPGIAWVFAGGAPCLRWQPLVDGALTLGRETLDDDRVSRRHAEVRCDGERWTVRDLGSRNGSFVDGRAVDGEIDGEALGVIRLGRSIGLFIRHGAPFAGGARVVAGDHIIGPTLAGALARVDRAAASGQNLLVIGESGAGKELAARRFHSAGTHAGGPFIAVNCAAIPQGIAERLLFGARRGAYSGADADAPGHVQAADGGVLFLDEIGELDLAVQAKLLRLLESKEVLALGAARARPVAVTFCFATHRNLRAAVAEGRLRADLYYRITEPEVLIPPLRARREEIPWLVAAALARQELRAHTTLIEACLLRPWPGNVRELNGAIRAAAERAGAERALVEDNEGAGAVPARALGREAGMGITPAAPVAEAVVVAPSPAARPPRAATTAEVEAALANAGGNVAAAARALGLHRTQLYRLMARIGVRPRGDE